jgi:NADP-dependent 3-hydroxy acid dehydrogenase YdfG
VITGAAAGIGRATAELFAREGVRLVLADINLSGLSGIPRAISAVLIDQPQRLGRCRDRRESFCADR